MSSQSHRLNYICIFPCILYLQGQKIMQIDCTQDIKILECHPSPLSLCIMQRNKISFQVSIKWKSWRNSTSRIFIFTRKKKIQRDFVLEENFPKLSSGDTWHQGIKDQSQRSSSCVDQTEKKIRYMNKLVLRKS